MGRVLKSNSIAKTQNTESHETRENNETTWQTRIHRSAVQFASTFVGQAIMMQFFKLLWTLEKSANWISNGKTDGKKGTSSTSLIRPLPWVLFLPTLITLRFSRVILSLISLCFGYNEIAASTMVTFLHDSHRHIRQILSEAKQIKTHTKYENSFIDYVKRIILSGLSNLSKLFSQTPNSQKCHNNKTSLNASSVVETEVDDEKHHNIENTDSEDEIYQRFLTENIDSSDTDDDDYNIDKNNEETSDTDANSAIDTDDLSNDDTDDADEVIEAQTTANPPTNSNSEENNEGNYSADTSTYVDQSENAKTDSHDDVQSSTGNESNDTLNKLFNDTTASTGAKSIHSHNRAKNINRNNKNGRKHANTQNNGKHSNGAHVQAKSKTVKHQKVESTTEFIAEEIASDRT